MDFTNHPAKDSGCLNSPDRFGLYDHSHIAFTPEGLCLGVLDVEFFDRDAQSLGKSKQRRKLPIEEKESYRWVKGCRLANEVAAAHPDTHIVSVSDSEGDIYELIAEFFQGDSPADFVIRAKQERCTPEASALPGEDYQRVYDDVAGEPIKVIRELLLPATPHREARTARLEVRSKSLVVKAPHARSDLDNVRLQVVLAEEVGLPADDETRVCWLLLTTLPVDTADATLAVLDFYTSRWPIEPFFRTYKTGCKVEDIQLKTTIRRKRCLMFYKVIAWRIMYTTHLWREHPEVRCNEVFLDHQWKPVWKIVSDKPLPEQSPTLAEFMPMLAQLGGYNNRRTERPPGPQPIWVGTRRMLDFAIAWLTFGPEQKST